MTKEARVEQIERIQNSEPIGKIEIPWEDELEAMNVYKIPLDCLLYNKYNGRILSRTLSHEKQQHKIDVESEGGKKLIADLLWDSKEDRNKKTLKSLKERGQEKVGIITRDGIIIDGNRRAMLLNRIPERTYFKAVILPVMLEENPLEIEKLETSYQMGEDEKLGYNPIEKYLKTKALMQRLSNRMSEDEAIEKISDWMGERKSEIQKYISVMDLMDNYLDSLNYNDIYTQLDGREDQFLNLYKWLDNFYDETSAKAFDGYEKDDVDDLRSIAYDYIRVKYEGKNFRRLADGLKGKHLFGNEEIWRSFSNEHEEFVEPILDEEIEIDFDSSDIRSHLNDRDRKFEEKVCDFLKENMDNHYQQIKNIQHKNEPEKLVKEAIKKIETISPTHELVKTPLVQEEIEGLKNAVDKLMKKSPVSTLEYINSLLDEMEIDDIEEKEIALEEIKKINKSSHEIKKILGG